MAGISKALQEMIDAINNHNIKPLAPPLGSGVVASGSPARSPQDGDIRINAGNVETFFSGTWHVAGVTTMSAGAPSVRAPSDTDSTFLRKSRRDEIDIPKIEGCPLCGHKGNFVRMSLMCPEHGVFGGC